VDPLCRVMKWCAKIAAYVEVHSLPDLSSSSLTKARRKIGFCGSRDSVSIWWNTYDLPERHHTGIRSAACVIAQQYSSVMFISLLVRSRWGRFGAPLKMFTLQLFAVIKHFVAVL